MEEVDERDAVDKEMETMPVDDDEDDEAEETLVEDVEDELFHRKYKENKERRKYKNIWFSVGYFTIFYLRYKKKEKKNRNKKKPLQTYLDVFFCIELEPATEE